MFFTGVYYIGVRLFFAFRAVFKAAKTRERLLKTIKEHTRRKIRVFCPFRRRGGQEDAEKDTTDNFKRDNGVLFNDGLSVCRA
jgi:hypothetical protein